MTPRITQEEIKMLLSGQPKAKRRKNKRVESALVNHCIKWLFAHGCYVWRNNTGARKIDDRYISYGLKGSPDIIGFTSSGTFIGIEAKAPKGKLSDEQINFQHRCLKMGAIYIVARSLDDLEANKRIILAS